MKRKSSWIAIALLMLITATAAMASNGTQIGTIGGRSTAMGSAFRGLSDDWSAVFFNPAGLTQLGKLTVGASLGTITPRGSYTPAPYSDYPSACLKTGEVDLEPKTFFVPAMAVFYRPVDKLVCGVGVFAPFGLGTEWDLIELKDAYGNSDGISKKNEHYSDHQVITIQPTLAYEISDKLSVGLGGSYIMGKMTIDQVVMAPHPLSETWKLMQAGGMPFPDIEYRLAVENNLEGDGTAIGANIGLLYKVTEKLQIGLSAQYYTDLALSGTIKQSQIFPGNDDVIISAIENDQIPDAAFDQPEKDPNVGAIKRQKLIEGVEQIFSGITLGNEWDVEADLPLPMTAGIGLAYKATPKLTLTADASWTNWASWGEIDILPKKTGYDTLTMKQNWKDTWQIGAGAEYQATECLSVLGGLYTVDTPCPDESIKPTILDPIRRWVLTGGVGYKTGKVAVNLTGEWVMFQDKELGSEDYEYDPETGVPDNYAGLYKFSAYVVTLATQIDL